jgi:putative transposase
MPNYRRNYVPGGTYFFTVVTHQRAPILTTSLGRSCLRKAIQTAQSKGQFKVFAIVLLPDHLHTVWVLPDGDADYSSRWGRIKEAFTRMYRAGGGLLKPVSASRRKHREQSVWQRRFWEHTCRDEDDLIRFVDYLHWNPRKHGLVSRIQDYPWSSFHRFVREGQYDVAWGGEDPCPNWSAPEWE